jgi:protocatechuate 3,4-dioxygenase alpha subunit
MSYPATASQTVGPYFRIGLSYLNSVALCAESTAGEHIFISGQVFDGAGVPVPDAQLELWQPDSEGRFAGLDPSEDGPPADGFVGFARVPTDEDGGFAFHTIRPGRTGMLDGRPQAPHIVLLLSMRGLLKHLYTRIYFAGDPRNDDDLVLLAIPAERRPTLFAQPSAQDLNHYRWNIQLQGSDETVFFQY